ncbi:MAG: PmoA family protein, partial [Planctomycetota bacterium]
IAVQRVTSAYRFQANFFQIEVARLIAVWRQRINDMKQLFLIALSSCLFAYSTLSIVHGGDLQLNETETTIQITLRGKPVLEYVKVASPVPDGIERHFERSGYIHPIYAPTGQQITGDYPVDHAHQHALFFAWTKSNYDGQKTDFWNQAKQLAGVEFRDIVNTEKSDEQVSFSTKHAFTVGTGDKKTDALYETWTVTVFLTPDDHFLFDIESVQQCAADIPLSIEEHHYGGMAIRGNIQWLKEHGDQSIHPGDLKFLTSEGKDRWEGNQSRPNWVAMNGKIDGQEVSLTVFCSPHNFRAPQHVRLHPNKPYFCFAPAAGGKFGIEPGQEFVSRYRFLVMSRTVDTETASKYWEKYRRTSK